MSKDATRKACLVRAALVAAAIAITGPIGVASAAATSATTAPTSTNATYFNDASTLSADPYVLYDSKSGYYYAYSTADANHNYHFAVYRSADLATWERVGPGALPVHDRKQWGSDWFWAPEVYHNSRTGLYFMFYAARSQANAKRWFGYSDFQQPSKIGVAVSRFPAGPFHNIAKHPIDYNPYDPTYHDVDLTMKPNLAKPPATLARGDRSPMGTYIPAIDPDVLFASDGRQYLYYSRASRNWVWDRDLRKYVEESDILAVELTTKWWDDRTGRTMPTIAPAYQGANKAPGGPRGPRRDGFVRILDYGHDKQAWENADVNDYKRSKGRKEDRRWEEGPTVFARAGIYYLIYSANNWQGAKYGVGYAVATSPLGPWRKYAGNPILSHSSSVGMYSTGHGCVAFSPDGSEMFYVHHGRPTPTDPHRWLYTERMDFGAAGPDPFGFPALSIDQSTSDQPIPSGVPPYRIAATAHSLTVRRGSAAALSWHVASARGAWLALSNPLNRVHVAFADPTLAAVEATADGGEVLARRRGTTLITLTYQRELSDGSYADVYNVDGTRRRLVSVAVRVATH
jgi:beta-xylosidase